MLTCSRTNINNKVSRTHCILVVFHHNQGISKVTQMLQRRKQLIIITLMQSNARLIQNISNSDKS